MLPLHFLAGGESVSQFSVDAVDRLTLGYYRSKWLQNSIIYTHVTQNRRFNSPHSLQSQLCWRNCVKLEFGIPFLFSYFSSSWAIKDFDRLDTMMMSVTLPLSTSRFAIRCVQDSQPKVSKMSADRLCGRRDLSLFWGLSVFLRKFPHRRAPRHNFKHSYP